MKAVDPVEGKGRIPNDKLKQEKPLVFAKSEKYYEKRVNNEYALAMIELAYDYTCNLHCQHCFAARLRGKGRKLTITDVRELSRQADELGVFQYNLQGGEPLLWNNLDELILALNPERFHITVTTNATMFNLKKAKHLKALGVDKISVSLDSFNAQEHDAMRQKEGLYQKTIDALFMAKEAGLQVNINTIVTRQNIRSKEIIEIAEFAEKNGFSLLYLVAIPTGQWEGRYDILITEDDARYLKELSKEHPVIRRDTYPAYGIDYGCRAMNNLLYITGNGDVLSCPFIHISIGSILKEPLKDILARGWRVKYFRDYNPKCLAGEDRDFIEKILSKTFGKEVPIPFDEAFEEKDLYPE